MFWYENLDQFTMLYFYILRYVSKCSHSIVLEERINISFLVVYAVFGIVCFHQSLQLDLRQILLGAHTRFFFFRI